jgi:hypothetical protein
MTTVHGYKLHEKTHCRRCETHAAELVFVDKEPDKDGTTWAVYVCIECGLQKEYADDLWKDHHVFAMI